MTQHLDPAPQRPRRQRRRAGHPALRPRRAGAPRRRPRLVRRRRPAARRADRLGRRQRPGAGRLGRPRRRPAVVHLRRPRLGGWLHDPQVTLDRRRTLTPAGLVEEIEVASRAQEAVRPRRCTSTWSPTWRRWPTSARGSATTPVAGGADRGRARLAPRRARLRGPARPGARPRSRGSRLTWTTTVAPGTSVHGAADASTPRAPRRSVPAAPRRGATSPSRRRTPGCPGWSAQSLADLGGLLMRTATTRSSRPAPRGS